MLPGFLAERKAAPFLGVNGTNTNTNPIALLVWTRLRESTKCTRSTVTDGAVQVPLVDFFGRIKILEDQQTRNSHANLNTPTPAHA